LNELWDNISPGCLLHNLRQPYWTHVKELSSVNRCSVTYCTVICLFLCQIHFQSCIPYSVTSCT
jgi:hypothetical protein